ncbi:MAG: NADH-quinone oxidoreductase subunit NuoF [Deltaproteobacteria bacterium]|nr:NADH-quinone oxidoreductase subunit NuoF [Deltaproteobacteria bacterium]
MVTETATVPAPAPALPVKTVRVVSRNWGKPNSHTLPSYRDSGGYKLWEKTVKGQGLKPQELIDTVKAAGLRGMGGAGFPTGVKWGFLPKDNPKPRYLVVNGDEGEPGTFKDRYIMELDPHMFIEGCMLSSYAINAHVCYIYLRGEFLFQVKRMEAAIDEARAAGLLGKNILGSGFDLDIHVHRGAGAYICGEETGLIESLEGKKGQPRLKPPFPAVVGVFGCPTIVNNVETLTHVVPIVEMGAEKWKALGKNGAPGTKLYGISGHVNKPGVYELPFGSTMRELLEFAGGVRDGKKLKAIVPGGASCPLLLPDQLDTPLDFDSIKKAGTMLGTACAIVMDESTCMVRAIARLLKFYAHESCGQCTPCREGTHWLAKMLTRIEHGEGREQDLTLIDEVANNIMGNTICALGDAAAMPTISYFKKFRHEFEEHVKTGKCRFGEHEVAPRQVTIGP